MSGEGARPEVLPGDLITRPGLYKGRGGDIVRITGWDNGWWVSEWNGTLDWYGSDGRQRFRGALDTGRWQLLHWVGPLPASEPEPETTSEQLAEIEGQPEPQPPAEPVQVREGRWKTRDGEVRNVTPTPEGDGRAERFPWWDAAYRQTWCANGKYHFDADSPLDLDTYLGRIEPQPQPEPQPEPIQVREGRWRTRGEQEVEVTAAPTDHDDFSPAYPWWDGDVMTWANDGRFAVHENAMDLLEYLGPIEPEIGWQAEAIGRLQGEAHVLNMEIGGLQRQLMQRDARIRDLETLHAAAAQAVVDAGKENDALRLQVQNRQNKCEQQKGRIGFLETLNAGNDAAISDYRTQVEKLHRLLDTARGQLEAAASEISEQLAAIDAADKQLDQKDAQIRDLRIELDAAQQVPRPVSDDERERIWDDATEQAGRQVIRWLKPLTLALNRQPDERFSRFMALTLSILPDVVPELLGYAVEDGAEGDCEE